jgi:hypothetical protein
VVELDLSIPETMVSQLRIVRVEMLVIIRVVAVVVVRGVLMIAELFEADTEGLVS